MNFERGIILVDGQRIRSYTELVRLAARDKYNNAEFIEVTPVLFIAGG